MVNSVAPALAITATAPDLHQLYAALKGMEGNLRVELRKSYTALGKPMVSAVQRQASWSTRIPGAVKAKTSFAAKSAGLSITVDAKKAPGARALEHSGNSGNFRHPVFGDRETWVSQPARPFFWSAVKGQGANLDKAMSDVMDTIARKAGFS